MNIKKGDKIKVISGKDKGKIASVLRMLRKEGRIIADGVNMTTRHLRPRKQGEKGQKAVVPGPLNISKVMLVCPKCNQPTRVGHLIVNGEKLRQCKKCKETI